ncbi:MAG: hypothetical protein K2K13_03060 [Clostridiales bacterium]|nr:hypothetical protein [Clostridiales bacterium]
MPLYAVCPVCLKTIEIERLPKLVCPDCGSRFGYAELQGKHFIVDERAEKKEINIAKDYFLNGEFTSALEHFNRALVANANSHAAKYFSLLCDIYLHDNAGENASDDVTGKPYDVIAAIVDMIRQSLLTLSRGNATVADKLAFITAMLSETKVLIIERLSARDEMFKNNIDEYRKQSISDLTKLLELFKIEREQIMSFAPEVSNALAALVDCAIKICYKAVQTVKVGEDIITPDDDDYKKLSSLCNDLCFFGHSFNPYFDSSPYSPNFIQNYEYNKKVLAKIKEFDDKNKSVAKKNVIADIKGYDSLLAECEKALEFTYLSCYRSMCSRQVAQHAQLFYDGFELVYKLLLPRVAMVDKKQVEVHAVKYADMAERCDMLTRFLVDSYELDESIGVGLHEYYEKLYDIVDTYYMPEIDKMSKSNDRNNLLYYQKLLYECACSCAPALKQYVDFSAETDKVRVKLVKICRDCTEEFLLRSGMSIDDIEQSNFYRPLLQISNALVDEENA